MFSPRRRSPPPGQRACAICTRLGSQKACGYSRFATQANFHTSSTHAPAIDTYRHVPVGSTASVTKLIARSRSHGFPLSVRLNGLRPAGLVHNYTNTHATYSNAPWAWARLVPQCLVNLSRPPAVATTRPPGGLSWVISSPALTGAGANHPPVMGGQLTFDALVDALPPVARVRWRLPGRARLPLPRRS